MDDRPIIGVTMGDPVGVGPEIIVKALARPEIHELCRPLVLGDLSVMRNAAARLACDLEIHPVGGPEGGLYRPGAIDLACLSQLDCARLLPGAPTKETGRAMVGYILKAIEWAKAKKIHGVATGPIHKGAMNAAGYNYNGHTEIFAEKTDTAEYVMMMAGERLRVVLVTIHMALSAVPAAVTREKILSTIRVTHRALIERFGIARPRLAVAALNPHAGEDGLFGDEEERVIIPAVREAREEGVSITGPSPADTLFFYAAKGACDAVVCMYHDQGLIPFKLLHFEDGVNTTLGLPIVRTSVDHGTAYDIAGTGQANPESLVAAVKMASAQARCLYGGNFRGTLK